jgi:MFS family permease
MQGRVFTLVMSLCNAATPLGMAIGGPVADAVGVRTLYVMGGVVAILLGAGGFFVPAIVHLEDNNRNGHTAAPGETLASAPVPVRVD